MPNENLLKGVSCPKCKQDELFKVSARSRFTVTDEGIEDFEDVEWEDDSYCECPDCGYSGKIKDFYLEEK